MTPEDRKEIKNSIKERIQELEESIKSLRETSKPVSPDRAIGRVTRMDAIQIQKMQEENLKVAQMNIEKLQESIKKADDDSFGQCHYCKEMIGIERLKALPESSMCIKCAEKYGR